MQKILYTLCFTILFLMLNGCSAQTKTPVPYTLHSTHTSAPYSLESLEIRYQQKGY